MKKIVYMPIETQSRELNARIALGHSLVDEEVSVLIADQQYIRANASKIKSSVYFGKHLFGKPRFQDRNLYDKLKKNMNSVIYLSEEGGIWAGDEKDWKILLERIEKPDLFEEDDIYCTWGEWQLQFANRAYELKCKSAVTGSPKFTILSDKFDFLYERARSKYNEKYGDYILINTAYSVYNGLGGAEGWFGQLLNWGGSFDEKLKFGMNKYIQQAHTVNSILELVFNLASTLKDQNFIIRPHPSENHDFYRAVFKYLDNVHIIYEGSANEWIAGSKLLIQSGCTTGIEAAFMNKPVVNWSPTYTRNMAEVKIVQSTGYTAQSIEEVMDIMNGKLEPKDLRKLPKDYEDTKLLENLNGIDSIRAIEDIISEVIDKKFKLYTWLPSRFTALRHKIYLRSKEIYYLISGNSEKIGDHEKRFGVFEREEIVGKVNSFNEAFGKNVAVSYLDKYGFVLEK